MREYYVIKITLPTWKARWLSIWAILFHRGRFEVEVDADEFNMRTEEINNAH